jgi:hypothetical protein
MTDLLIGAPTLGDQDDRRRSNTTSCTAPVYPNGWLMAVAATEPDHVSIWGPRPRPKTALTHRPFSWIDHLIRPLQERRRDSEAEGLGDGANRD